MGKQFTIKILPSEEFDKLPFKRAKTAMGAADPKSGIAFVRDTGFNDMTKATMEHELDELMASTSAHEEEGIRYKDFSQILGSLGSSVPGIGGLLGPVGTAVGTVPDVIGAGISKAGSGISSLFGGGGTTQPQFDPGPAPSVPGITGSQAGGPNLNIDSKFANIGTVTPPSAQASGGIENVLSLQSGLGTGGGGGLGGSQTIGGQKFNFVDAVKGFGGDVLGGLKTALQGSPGGTTGPAGGAQIPGFGEQLGRAIPGTAVSLAGNLFAPKPSTPDFSGITSRLNQQVSGGQGPLFQEALDVGRGVLTTPPGQPQEQQFLAQDRAIDEQLGDALDQLRNTFKSLNPTADPENNSRFATEANDLQQRAAQLKAEIRGNAVQQQIQDQLRVMEDFLNIDSSQTQQLIQIAQLEVDEIIIQTGLEVQEANEFKQLFGNVGEALLNQQFQPQTA